jgi:non-ribosomal peptide synthetase component F
MIEYFNKIFDFIIENPGQNLAGIEIITAAEKRQVLYEFNDKDVHYPGDKTIHRLFEEQIEQAPDHIALVGAHELHEKGTRGLAPLYITYRELNNRSHQLAIHLKEKGVKPDTIVGLLVKRSVEMIVGILGIVKAGGAYLPIDPKNPPERTKYMLTDSNARILVTTSILAEEHEKLKRWEGKKILLNAGNSLAGPTFGSSPLERGAPGGRGVSEAVHPTHLAYIIYTSGSTGIPKGVPICHANFSPLIHWGYRHLKIGPGDRVIQIPSYYFDWSVWEIFITFFTGASLFMITEDTLLNPDFLVNFIIEKGITILHMTPTQYQYIMNVGKKLETLKYLLLGGEKLTVDLALLSFE